jgi:hypothetical protein
MMRTRKTLINFKISTGRTARQFFQLVFMLLGFSLFLGLIGLAQFTICRQENPWMSFKQCVGMK